MTLNTSLTAAALLALLIAQPALAAPAAHVDFAVGDVVARSLKGAQRAVSRGAQLESGDTVLTNSGRAQMRFTDGSLVSLKPGSEFRIDDYHYSGKPDGEERGFFSLLKGGLRTITGWVGRSDRTKYQVKTVVATIGVRGTEYSVTYGNSINVNTGEGVVEVCNDGGCLLLYPGDEGYVSNASTEPVLVQSGEERPKKDGTPQEISNIEAPANDRDPTGVSGTFSDSAPPKRLAYSLQNVSVFRSGLEGGAATFGAPQTLGAPMLTFDTTSSGNFGMSGGSQIVSGSALDSVSGSEILSWGRWEADTVQTLGDTISTPFGSTSGPSILHYVVGAPTTFAGLGSASSLPSATFSSLGGSVSDATNQIGSVSSTMDVSFSTLSVSSLQVDISVGVSVPSIYQISGGGYAIATAGGLTFSGNGSTSFFDVNQSQFVACTTCSSASIQGAFYGTGASHAGVAFNFNDSTNQIAGITALEQLTGGRAQ